MKKLRNFLLIVFVLSTLGYKIFTVDSKVNDSITVSAKSYVQQATTDIVKSWSVQVLNSHASPRLVEYIEANMSYKNRFESLRQLGDFRKIHIESGQVNKIKTVEGKTEMIGDFKVRGDFERAETNIAVKVILVNNKWKILVFNVFTPMRLIF